MDGLALRVEGLACGYGAHAVLSDLHLSAQAGEVLALAGPNGAGKTTLLRVLARLLRPLQGQVWLGPHDLWRLTPRAAARRIGLVPQAEALTWPLTVEQVVGLGRAAHRGWFLPLGGEDRKAVDEALRQTGLLPLRGRPVTTLSGGERQRVLIARALAQTPVALLLDEPTAHLDLQYQGRLLGLARRLAHERGLIVVVSLHDLNLAALYADRLALLAQGRLLVCGPPAEALTPSYLETAYGVPVSVTRHPLYGTPLVAPLPNGHE